MPLTAANSTPIQTQGVGDSTAAILTRRKPKKKAKEDDHDSRGASNVQPDTTAAILTRRKK